MKPETMMIAVEGIYKVAVILSATFRDFAHGNRENPLDELLFILCSTKTTNGAYESTFAGLKRRFPTFTSLANATEEDLRDVLKRGGLQNVKARLLFRDLRAIVDRFGRLTLAPLKRMSDENCEDFLCSLPGVGKKVARCVMMYSLGRQVFPVDTHSWRICRLGWVSPDSGGGSSSPKQMDALQETYLESCVFLSM